MNKTEIKQAQVKDIPVIESILLNAVNWLNEAEQPLWRAENVKWVILAKSYKTEDFYIAFLNGEPAGCMVLIDYDPFFWPDVAKGEALMIHKLAVTKLARKTGVSDELIDYAKREGIKRQVSTIRLDCHQYRNKLRVFYEKHGFVCVDEKTFNSKCFTSFYVYSIPDYILSQNKCSWDAMADEWFGVTALPVYGCLCPTEDELCLFPELSGKKVLDIGCGSGHSLKWCGDHGAAELWGLDISGRQLENAQKFLAGNSYAPKLFCSPMEENPGLPTGYFDVVYSIYAIGWTVDLQKTFNLISSYLKPGGIFIFSWDHPFMHCVEVESEKLIFSGSYYEARPFTFEKGGNPVTLYNHRLSDYINALGGAGFIVERVVEETDKETIKRDCEFSSKYYAPCKAKRFPLSIIVKARKL